MTLVVPVVTVTQVVASILLLAALMEAVAAQVLVVPTQAQVALVLLVPLLQEVGVLPREAAKIDTKLKKY
jgi:hypothetical protein